MQRKNELDRQYKIILFDTIDELADFYAPFAGRANNVSWQGGMNGYQALAAARKGHLPSVERSEQYLTTFEHLAFKAHRFEVVNDVAGGAPNVGALLAGSPLSMRRRTRVVNEYAPLTVFCDLGSSASVSADYQKMRGACVLALCRMLSATRPVQLYAVAGLGPSFSSMGAGMSGIIMVRLPLDDLSRTAFMLAHTAAQRAVMYGSIQGGMVRQGGWAFGNVDAHRTSMLGVCADMVNANPADCLYVPPVFHQEDRIEPKEWLPMMLEKYGVANEGDD